MVGFGHHPSEAKRCVLSRVHRAASPAVQSTSDQLEGESRAVAARASEDKAGASETSRTYRDTLTDR